MVPWWLLQIGDLAWMACVALSSRFSVPEPPLRVTWSCLDFDEEIAAADDAELSYLTSRAAARRAIYKRACACLKDLVY